MGRYYSSKKNLVEDTLTIQTWFLSQHGYFRNSQSGTITWTRDGMAGETSSSIGISTDVSNISSSKLQIHYTQTDRDTRQKKDFNYSIQLTSTHCNFGGIRFWFVCPLSKDGVYCGKRVGCLYMGSSYFGCRYCFELAYKKQNENRRSQFFYFGRIFDIDDKIDKLNEQIKRPYYAGKPTRKQLRLQKLYDDSGKVATVMKVKKWV